MKKTISLLVGIIGSIAVSAQNTVENSDDRMYCNELQVGVRNIVRIPDIDGYKTLKCDFHIHTVYADAMVSPQGRVREAWYDGLDVMAMTEHVGVHKTENVILEDNNRPFILAEAEAKKYGLMLIHGVEITRAKPFGHMNALFIEDSNVISEDRYMKDKDGKLLVDEEGRKVNNMETLKADIAAVKKQGAFIQWNHPGWPDKKCDMYPIHKEMLERGEINAVELFNAVEWYPKVLDWFDEYHIPMTANTDIHSPSNYQYGSSTRPMTLVFAKEYTQESLKEAMFDGRMLAYFEGKLAGDGKLIEELVHSCLSVKVINAKKGLVEVSNLSDIKFTAMTAAHMYPIVFHPGKAIVVTVKEGEKIEFLNCLTGRKNLEMAIW